MLASNPRLFKTLPFYHQIERSFAILANFDCCLRPGTRYKKLALAGNDSYQNQLFSIEGKLIVGRFRLLPAKLQ